MYAINNNKEGTVTIPIVYHTNENIDIFFIKGEKRFPLGIFFRRQSFFL